MHRFPRKISPIRCIKISILSSRADSSSPALRLRCSPSRKNWQQSLIPQDSPPVFSMECSQNDQEEISNEPPNYDEDISDEEPPSDEDISLYDGQIEDNTDCNDDRVRFLGDKKKRRGDPSIERRFRKKTSKGHGCTKCARFRLHKYFSEVSRTICISCLDICITCGISISNPPMRKARNPQCSSCAELNHVRKKCVQRLRMQALRLKKSLKP